MLPTSIFSMFHHHYFMNPDSPSLEKTDSASVVGKAPAPTSTVEPSQPSIFSEFRALIERSLELELVLSGAVTFSLLQVPSALEALQTSIITQYGTAGVMLLFVIMLAKPIAYILVGSLLLHLVVRSFWIGMIGVSSVYPNSEKRVETGGAFYRQIMQAQRGLKEQAASVDKFCRLIFGFSFSIIAIFIGVFVVIVLSFSIALLVQKFFFPSANILRVLLTVYVLLFLPYLVLSVLDTAIYHIRSLQHLQHNETLKKLYNRVYRGFGAGFGSAAISVLNTIATHEKRTYYIIMSIAGVAFAASTIIGEVLTWRTHPYFPEDGAASAIEHNFYEHTLDADNPARVMIQSDIISEPYLKLFLSYNTRYNDSLRKYFPGTTPFYTQGLSVRVDEDTFPPERLKASVDALRGLYTITLNGKNLDSTNFSVGAFRFYVHPKTKQKGILGYIRIDSLPKGEQMLLVRDRFDSTVVRYIPFWR